MMELTKRQKEILQWIVGYVQTYLRPPTIPELADDFNIQYASAYDIIRALQKKGYLEQADGAPRAIKPINLCDASMGCVDGKLFLLAKTGSSIADVDGFNGLIHIQPRISRGQPLFTVRITDNSMAGALIASGDLAVVRQQDYADGLEIVIASYRNKAVVRRLVCNDDPGDEDDVVLKPENEKYPDIKAKLKDITIYGKVIVIFRESLS